VTRTPALHIPIAVEPVLKGDFESEFGRNPAPPDPCANRGLWKEITRRWNSSTTTLGPPIGTCEAQDTPTLSTGRGPKNRVVKALKNDGASHGKSLTSREPSVSAEGPAISFGYDNLFQAVAEVEIATMKTLADIGIIPAADIASLTRVVEQELLAIRQPTSKMWNAT